jgi:hypothetical protein
LASDGGHALTMQFQNHDEFPQCDHRLPVGGASTIRRNDPRPGMPRGGWTSENSSALLGSLCSPGAELPATIFGFSSAGHISATPPSR